MGNIEILKELFDEKIIEIIKLFLEHPEKQFYLSEVASLSKVSVTTTFRILNKLIKSGFINDTIIGKFRVYRLEKGEKARFLSDFLKKEYDPVEIFLNKIKMQSRLNMIILKERNPNSAKFLLVGNFISPEDIERVCHDIKRSHNFSISFLVLSEKQFESMKEMNIYEIRDKVLWKRDEEHLLKDNK